MIWKIRKKSKLKCEMIWKIWKKSKLKCETMWKIWKKDKLNSEMIWKIWKKSKLNSEKIWKIWKDKGNNKITELTEWNGTERVDLRFWEPIRFLPSMVSACLCHSGKSCVVLRKWWTIWSVEWKTENPWTGDIIYEKTSTSSLKPLNWQFTSGSTSPLMENGHCILRREEWPWVFTNRKNWKRPYLYLKKESHTEDNEQ